ncbi:MAG: M48 family metallopeptidase [Deltaproteobacteria bacterium]|nr:M48 family metallopeptidase [Deltaproteobacteria bacterium]
MTILLERSDRAKHISISIKPFYGVRVAVPCRVSFKKAEKVARSKIGWIEKHLRKMKQTEKNHRELTENSKPIDKKEAGMQLVQRLNELSKKHGFAYNKVFIKNQKTRWGSCSEKNNINLNYNLARLPDELIDYTLLHELVHTRVKDHSKRFWDQLDRITKDAKKLDRRLRDHSLLLL